MERAIIHSDLIKKEIHPSVLLKEYLSLLEEDIRKLLPAFTIIKAASLFRVFMTGFRN